MRSLGVKFEKTFLVLEKYLLDFREVVEPF
jgi:hypothetical protein